MKMIELFKVSFWTITLFCSLMACGLLLRFLFLKYLHHAKIAYLRDLEFFCEIYKLTALTDNVESILLTAPEKREEIQYHCQVRTACLDRLNALSIRHHKYTYSILEVFNPFQSQTKLNFFRNEEKEVQEYIKEDALVILDQWKKRMAQDFLDAKTKSNSFTGFDKIDA